MGNYGVGADKRMIYLDNAATTRPNEDVLDVMIETARAFYGNPSSLYHIGGEAERRLESSRRIIAKALGAAPEEFYFTATGTEANNIAVLGAARARKNFGDEVVITGYEHPSVFETAMSLKSEGFRVHTVNPGRDGRVDAGALLALVSKKTALVAAMSVNNETGATTDVATLAEAVKKINPRTAVHCDHVQGFLKTGLMPGKTAIDTAAVSGHKLHAPKGVGGLYVRKGFNIRPVLFGGGQEGGLRSGTENLPSAAAFAKAVESYPAETARKTAKALNARLRERLAAMAGVRVNSPDDALPFILNFSVPGLLAQPLLNFLDERGVMVSSGSACSKGLESRTLTAMGLHKNEIDTALRVSFSGENTAGDVDRLAELLDEAKHTLVRA